MYRPGGPFAREHDEWINEWARAGIGRTQLLVMLKLCERLEFDDHGHATAWYPRAELARDIGVTENDIKAAVRRLKKLEFLRVKEAGRSGAATLYTVMPHTKWPPQRGYSDVPPDEKKGVRDGTIRGYSDVPPLRINSGGEAADAAPRHEIAPRNSFWEAASNDEAGRAEYERRHDETRERGRVVRPDVRLPDRPEGRA